MTFNVDVKMATLKGSTTIRIHCISNINRFAVAYDKSIPLRNASWLTRFHHGAAHRSHALRMYIHTNA